MAEDFDYPEPDPNKVSDKDRWEKLYEGDTYLFGKEPSAFLKSHIHLLAKGTAMDIGMGEGRNAVYLASQGFEVSGIDASAKAIDKANKLASEKGVSIDAKTQNLDFFLMPLMKFDTVVMTYLKPSKRFFSEILRGLKNNGTFIFEAHTTEHYKKIGHNNPVIQFEDCFKPNEPMQHLSKFHVLYYSEIPQGESNLVQAICRKIPLI